MLAFLCKGNFSMETSLFTRKFLSSTPTLVSIPLPSPRETHFWYIIPDEVQNTSLLDQYLGLLSPIEKEDILRMKGDRLQKNALLARVLLRTTLARCTVLSDTKSQVGPRSFKFRKNLFGKPEVAWEHYENWKPPPLHFNLSHTLDLVACGVSADMRIGIDVEEKQRRLRNNILSFARRYFSCHEVEFLCTLPDSETQQKEFIKLWTLKEAYVKAIGKGFSASPFSTFTIRFVAREGSQVCLQGASNAFDIVLESSDDSMTLTNNWEFALFELAKSHYASICIEKNNLKVKDNGSGSMGLKVWKTIPFVEDECVSGTEEVLHISGLL